MATHGLLSLAILLGLLTVSVTGRPCKTFFLVSRSVEYPIGPNPDSEIRLWNHFNPSTRPPFLTFDLTESPEIEHELFFYSYEPNRGQFGPHVEVVRPRRHQPIRFYPSITRSARDRTKDILGVAGALLFGVGCGALTATTMFLIWALFSPYRFEVQDSDEDFDDGDDFDDDDGTSPNKMGYFAIPADVDAVKPAPAKEVV